MLILENSFGCANVGVFHSKFRSFLIDLKILDRLDIPGYWWPPLRLYLARDPARCDRIRIYGPHYLALVIMFLLFFHDHHREVLNLLVLLLRDFVNSHQVGGVVR